MLSVVILNYICCGQVHGGGETHCWSRGEESVNTELRRYPRLVIVMTREGDLCWDQSSDQEEFQCPSSGECVPLSSLLMVPMTAETPPVTRIVTTAQPLTLSPRSDSPPSTLEQLPVTLVCWRCCTMVCGAACARSSSVRPRLISSAAWRSSGV